ncbi:DegT/DnrJ/EryC1/StrS family aminotransferase [Butyrivibrio sp. XBB1001]|uniref:DegT/DnrJ/EryC1/StrS family aminotransferase n=1 Tax=Butyrivibrio sp. XBB1001 TaxID=1280682 RepID=UPI0003F5B239|nr:DegT/DnrJ/EryC1/StrS family aminotransferase [Butyrivibrio sp. XBB1001]
MEKKTIHVCTPALDGNEEKYVMDAVSTGWISSSGSYVNRFEEAFSKYCETEHGIAVTNGTVAIHLALTALGIGKGDKVIIPSFTMIATAFAVCYTGAMPVFVDADKETWNIDVKKIEEKIDEHTKAIIPVHIFGNPCDMDEINALAKKYGIYVIEDAAEAHGAIYKGRKVGSLSDVAAFSFFANKNITTGEGGMCVTNNTQIAEQCRYYKNMCFPLVGPRNYMHDNIGFNYRMSNLHAALGLAQVERADDYRAKRIYNHDLYLKELSDVPGIVFQKDEKDSVNVNWMNTIVIDPKKFGANRDEVIQRLKDNGVETRLLFNSMSKQKALKDYGCDCSGEYPVTDWLADNGFYMPSGSDLSEEDIHYVCQLIKDLHIKKVG